MSRSWGWGGPMRLLHRVEQRVEFPAARTRPDDFLVVVTTPDFTWLRLLEASAYALLGLLVFVSLVVLRTLQPVAALLAVLLVTAVVLLRLPNRYGGPAVAAVALLYGWWTVYLGGLVALRHPSSAAEFWQSATALVMVVAIVAAALSARWRRPPSHAPAWVGLTALATCVAAAAVAVTSTIAYHDAVQSAADVPVRIERFEWAPKVLSVDAGEVTMFVENRDGARHVFAIDALAVRLEIPASHAARVRFRAPAGTYRFACTVSGHEHHGIRGTLFVQ